MDRGQNKDIRCTPLSPFIHTFLRLDLFNYVKSQQAPAILLGAWVTGIYEHIILFQKTHYSKNNTMKIDMQVYNILVIQKRNF